jgi:hypothetical protein
MQMSTNTLVSGAVLTANQSIISNNGTYILKVAATGIVFLDNQVTGQRLWVQGRLQQVRPVLTMQLTGDLVFTEGNPSTPVWDSGTSGYLGAYAVLSNNGNLVIYDASGDPIWSTGTAQGAAAAAPAALVEMRAAFENALTKLSVVERAFVASHAAATVAASVNVRNSGADAE